MSEEILQTDGVISNVLGTGSFNNPSGSLGQAKVRKLTNALRLRHHSIFLSTACRLLSSCCVSLEPGYE